jgi:hypothetical protein
VSDVIICAQCGRETPTNVSAKLRPPVVRVDPGGESVIVLALHNTGTIVDEYAVEVLGEAAAWITVEPPRLPLFPGDEGAVTVEPFLDLSARLVPRTSRGRLSGRHDVCITCGGNAPVRAALSAIDPDELLRFRFAPAALTIAPGQTATPWVRAKPRR